MWSPIRSLILSESKAVAAWLSLKRPKSFKRLNKISKDRSSDMLTTFVLWTTASSGLLSLYGHICSQLNLLLSYRPYLVIAKTYQRHNQTMKQLANLSRKNSPLKSMLVNRADSRMPMITTIVIKRPHYRILHRTLDTSPSTRSWAASISRRTDVLKLQGSMTK